MKKVELNKKKETRCPFEYGIPTVYRKGIPEDLHLDIVNEAGVAKGTFYLYLKIN